MLGKLFTYIASLPKKLFKKESVDDALSLMYSDIRQNIKPMLDTLVKVTNSGTANNKLSDLEFFKGTDIEKEFKTIGKLLKAITFVIAELEKNHAKLSDLTKDLPVSISTSGLTTDQALLFNIMDNIKFFTDYTADVIVVLFEYVDESGQVAYGEPVLRGKKKSSYDYYNILIKYNNFENILVELDNLVVAGNEKMLESVLADKKIDVVASNFIGSPIYHVRLWLVDKDIEKIKLIEKKKEYIELLVMEIELKQANTYDPELSEQLENAKGMINEYEDKIEKLVKKNQPTRDMEEFKVGGFTVYELGDDNNGATKTYATERDFVLDKIKNGTMKKVSEQELTKIRKDITDDVYKEYADYAIDFFKGKKIEAGYGVKEGDAGVYVIGGEPVDIIREKDASGRLLFRSVAFWYDDEKPALKAIEIVLKQLKKHLNINFIVQDKNQGDYYYYLIDNSGNPYDIYFDVSHDGDSINLASGCKWDLVESIKEYC